MVAGCFGGSGAKIDAKVDPKVLEDKAGVQKIYDAILKSMGGQATKADEITINIDNPADKGNTGDAYLVLMIDMQNPNNPKQLLRQLFHGELGYWQPAQELTVDVRGSSEEKENFRLEDELFDFKSDMSAEKLHKIILDAYEKDNKEQGKYTYRYVDNVRISIQGIYVSVKGKLAANDQMINNSYTYDLDGNFEN
jgi:hypothetical protein